MVQSIIALAFTVMTEAIKKKRGKIYKFLISEETQNTIKDFYFGYVTLLATLEDDEDE